MLTERHVNPGTQTVLPCNQVTKTGPHTTSDCSAGVRAAHPAPTNPCRIQRGVKVQGGLRRDHVVALIAVARNRDIKGLAWWMND
ncbi:TPA: hypothetical protein ACQZLP_003490 [Klebsiella variicola subsp. variicola]|nr:hypothetical protein [Klebsiella variicola]